MYPAAHPQQNKGQQWTPLYGAPTDAGELSDSSDDELDNMAAQAPAQSVYGGSRGGRPDKIRLPNPQMPKFDGTMGEWDNFAFQFTNMSEYYQLNKRAKLQQLKSCLTGKAVNFVRTLSPRSSTSYTRLSNRLRDRFAGTERAEVIRSGLHDVKQRVDEAVDEYADRIQSQVALAYPGQNQGFIDMTAKDAFIRGVRDRNAALEASKTNPQTVREALTSMKQYSGLLKAILGKASLPAARQVSFMDDLTTVRHTSTRPPTPPRNQMESKSVQVGPTSANERYRFPTNFNQTRSPPRSPSRSPGRRNKPLHDRCYNCDQTGHFRADCPMGDSPKANGR